MVSMLLSCGGDDPEKERFSALYIYAPSSATYVGYSLQLSAIAMSEDYDYFYVTGDSSWSSSNTSVATVSASGLVTGISHGTAVIHASFGLDRASMTITVIPIPVSPLVSIEVTPSSATILNGTSRQFTATGTYSDASTLVITDSVDWASSDTSVATVDASGLATSTGSGTAIINASLLGIKSNNATLTVKAELVSIAVTPSAMSIANGTTQQFTATGTYDDATTQDLTTSVTWNSGNTGVATIDGSGLASSLSEGTAVINATSGGVISGDATLTVGPAVLNSITVTPSAPSIANGLTQQFTATGTYTDSSTKDITGSVTWSSGDSLVVSVDASGFGFANSINDPSTVDITATDGGSGINNSASVTVYGQWKLLRYELNEDMDAFINSVTYYVHDSSPTGRIENTVTDSGNDGSPDRIVTYYFNTSGLVDLVEYDNDGDYSADWSYWYFYNAAGMRNFIELDYTGDGLVDADYTYYYNSPTNLERHESDYGPNDIIDAYTYYYHDASNFLVRKDDGDTGEIYTYEYDANGNMTYEGTDITGDAVPESGKMYIYDLGTNELLWFGRDDNGDRVSEYEEAYSYTYDGDGNLSTMDTDISNTGIFNDVTTYYWSLQ
jgi:hypothetical protein